MSLDDACATTDAPWSIIASASTNSALAGVLAGFLLAAIAVLYEKDNAEHTQTLALFFTGVVILGIDSYLFSNVTGVIPVSIQACARAWTQGISASGMLAVGSIALVAGLGWMLTRFALDHRSKLLGTLGGTLTGCLVLVTTGLLVGTAAEYLTFIYDGQTPKHVLVVVLLVSGVPVLVSAVVVGIRTWSVYRLTPNPAAAQGVNVPSLEKPCTLGWATGSTAVLAVLAPIWNGILPFLPAISPGHPSYYILVPTSAIGLGLPGVIAILISCAVPKLV